MTEKYKIQSNDQLQLLKSGAVLVGITKDWSGPTDKNSLLQTVYFAFAMTRATKKVKCQPDQSQMILWWEITVHSYLSYFLNFRWDYSVLRLIRWASNSRYNTFHHYFFSDSGALKHWSKEWKTTIIYYYYYQTSKRNRFSTHFSPLSYSSIHTIL